MLKKTGLSYIKNKHLKLQNERKFVEVSKAKSAGILVKDLNKNSKSLNVILQKLKQENIKCVVLSFLENKEEFNSSICDLALSYKDMNWLGKINKEEIKKFINSSFDYLICLNTSPFLPFENILAQSKAKCRIGIQHPENANCYELTIGIKETNDLNKLSHEIMRYMTTIKTSK